MKKTILATSVSLALMATASQAWSDVRTLKFHSGLAESRPEAASLERFSELVDEYSDGQLQVDVYHAGSLGLKEADMLRIMQRGMVDMALMYGEYYNRDAPEMASIYAQGAITEAEQHLDILPTLRELYREGYADWGIHTIGGVVAPVFDVGLHCKEPVNSLEGLRDKKVRVWSGHLVETFDRLGISAQVIPQNDMYLALQTGVVDCAYYLSTVAKTVSLQEVTDYEAYLHPWAASPWMFGVSDRTWNSLDEQQQEILTRAGEEIWKETRDQAVDPEREAEARKEREAMGITMLPAFSDEDVQTFVDAAWEAWYEMASKAGDEGIRYYDTVTGELQSDSQ
ncbi:TRAP transporter substrate-binding protein [Halomonas elongata]|uniref:TRAP transporter substrate-binding protein n=1 Tax=Halomonas elongata (strain ATCC 33173 / DSM 2581 / NBRC 15536 / NCIMB 2198 / 1H9) TaxID=768066 RepID=E1V777_HALED|nr:TRAP transporter substrate-binding protein [Halomonas elongata]MDL4861939.1 TRAP transporter substrate-binding protein [Halomonas elongata]WBF18661.1 TRAP transporter substrate-binding protein [Halomonas elongata]WPU47516.1 TRAP transporter substrate-binding protein [Halomonas elongata DSM 2581]CBV41427.1 TRAP transporter substrate-binding protein [Halomonas elongata DSM 2581]